MPQGLPTSRIVPTSISLASAPAQAESVNTCLVLGSSPVIDITERMREYGSITEVAADFGTTAPEYLAALPWFEFAPQPTTLNIGRWAKTATSAQLIGALIPAAQQAIANWTAITSGAFTITLDGAVLGIAGLNFSAAGNLNAVAADIQAALITAGANSSTTFLWNAEQQVFELTDGHTGVTSTVSFLSAPTASGTATFSALPAANDVLTLDGTAVTFVSGTPTGNQVKIGADVPTTLASLLTFLNASTDVNLTKMSYSVSGSVLYIVSKQTGTAGDSLTLAKTSTNIAVSGATLAGGSGTDISAMLGMTATSSGAYIANGVAPETAVSAVALFDDRFSNQFYGLCIPEGADSDHLAVAAYVEASSIKHYYGVTTQEGGALVATDTSNIAYLLHQAKYDKTAVQFSSTSGYAVMAYLAQQLVTNWNGSDTASTEFGKQQPGIVAETLSTTQANALKAINCNVYVNYNNGIAIVQDGTSASGNWTDLVIGADQLAINCANDVFNLLTGTPTKVPQTDPGMHVIGTTLSARLAANVANGFLAPGVWNAPGFGALKQGQYLPKGYYVYQPSVDLQAESDRTARKSVPFQIAAKTAGAVHSAPIAIVINQ